MFNEQFCTLLGLSAREVRVINCLKSDKLLSLAEVVRATKIPRMTIYPILAMLKQRGLIDFHRKGKRRFWSLVDKKAISASLWKVLNDLGENDTTEVRSGDSGFVIINGIGNLIRIWEKAVKTYKENRIYGIQSTASLLSILSKINWEKVMAPINDAILKKGLIVEGLTREDYMQTYLNFFKNDKNLQKNILNSFLGRTTDMVHVENSYLNYPVDLLMFEDKGFLINWKDEIAVEINNKDMLGLLIELFNLARGYGKRIDQNEYISRLLANLENQ